MVEKLSHFDLVWDHQECPNCHIKVIIGLMSVSGVCDKCGAFYADAMDDDRRGWYRNARSYYEGEKKISI